MQDLLIFLMDVNIEFLQAYFITILSWGYQPITIHITCLLC